MSVVHSSRLSKGFRPRRVRLPLWTLCVLACLASLGVNRELAASIIGSTAKTQAAGDSALLHTPEGVLLTEPSLFTDAAVHLDQSSKEVLLAKAAEEPEISRAPTIQGNHHESGPIGRPFLNLWQVWIQGPFLPVTRSHRESAGRESGDHDRQLHARPNRTGREPSPKKTTPKRATHWGQIGESPKLVPDAVCRCPAAPCVTKRTRLVQDLIDPPRGGTAGMVEVFWL